ncbi:putative maleylacetoacetate isomerase 2-like protein [Leptotrombidium deliense]|uniref:maleylacetoacetate isomerase n=1 Tax=Leptotrombidium deliense TaxID=299467 RepID=A0A443STK1_9ACAR|nr:putative maleylacetoacetate isomerase 2-like protein [Leptotrombidium deliense]
MTANSLLIFPQFMCLATLEHKGISYEYRAVNLIKNGGEQHSQEFKRINPFSQVPALIIENNGKSETIVQSMAILEYLEEKYPKAALLPVDAVDRAKVRSLCECIASGIQPLQNLGVLNKIEELGGSKGEWAAHVITDKFKALEEMLKECSGKYCFGNSVTLADVCLIPQVYNAKRFSVDLNMFPIISSVCKQLEQLEAFQKSHPDNQPDSP